MLDESVDLSLADSTVFIGHSTHLGAPVGNPSGDHVLNPGWAFTTTVNPAQWEFDDNGGAVPVRIELHGASPDLPIFGRVPLDVDPGKCPGIFDCAILDVNRPKQSDYHGLDLWLSLVSGEIYGTGEDTTSPDGSRVKPGGAGTWCARGTEFLRAEVCLSITRDKFTVTRTVNPPPPDGPDQPHACTVSDCSINEAIETAGTPGTEIVVPSGHYVLERGEFLVLRNPGVTLAGAASPGGVLIEQTFPESHVLEVGQPLPDLPTSEELRDLPVTVSNVTLTGGGIKDNSVVLPGHMHGAGVHNHGTLVMKNVTLTGNHAPANGGTATGRGGGGFYNAGTATLINVTIAGNTAQNGGAGISGSTSSRTFLHNTLVVNNTGGDGNCIAGLDLKNMGGNLEYPGNTCGDVFDDATADPAPAATGAALTWPPVRGGQAVDGGVFASPTADFCLTGQDQLGLNRPQQGVRGAPPRCDVGARELRLPSNTSPSVAITAPPQGYRVAEGSGITLTAVGSDPQEDPLTYQWLPDAQLTGATTATPTFKATDEGTYPLTVQVSDGELTVQASVTVTVDNVAPTVAVPTLTPPGPNLAGTTITASTQVTDPGISDMQTCTFTWDDPAAPQSTDVPSSSTGTPGVSGCTATHRYASAGVYTVTATASDGDGGSGSASNLMIVFDPAAGSISGAGTMNSPAGALPAAPTSSTMAVWSVTARYQRGDVVPTGTITYRLLDGGFTFTSTSLRWLVVSGDRVQVGGTGTVGGIPGFRFLLTGRDGRRPGRGGSDQLRLKVANETTGNVVYDNVLDPAANDDIDSARPGAILNGALVIH